MYLLNICCAGHSFISMEYWYKTDWGFDQSEVHSHHLDRKCKTRIC